MRRPPARARRVWSSGPSARSPSRCRTRRQLRLGSGALLAGGLNAADTSVADIRFVSTRGDSLQGLASRSATRRCGCARWAGRLTCSAAATGRAS